MKKLFINILFAGLLLSAASCKKDNTLTDSKENVLLYMPQAASGFKGLQIYPLSNVERNLILSASYGGEKYPANDIAVKFEVSQAAFDSVNNARVAAGLAAYEKFPADAYSIDKWDGVIRKGELTSDDITLRYYPKKFDSQKNYLLAVAIKDASGFSLNPKLKTTFITVEKLVIEGKYASSGLRKNYNADGSFNSETNYTRDKDITRYINPLDPSSLEFDIAQVANLDPRTNTVFRVKVNPDFTVVVFGTFDAPNQPIASVPGEPNFFDPTTKTFVLNYTYTFSTGIYSTRASSPGS